MYITKMKAKVSYATVTHKDLFYVGSITIDEDIMDAVGLQENEQVQVVNLNNGERLETYVIKGKRGENVIGLNGPAARKAEIGDQVFIIAYAMINPDKETLEPSIVHLKEGNKL